LPSTADPDVLSLADALRPCLLRVSRQLRREAHRAGVSALDALVLGSIKRRPGVGVCDLADDEQMSRPAMSGHVKRLEQAGWIVRAGNPDDARRSGLRITPEGEAQLLAIRRHRNDWLAGRLTGLDDAQRAALQAAVAPMLDLLAQRG